MSDHLGAGKTSTTCCPYCGVRLTEPPWTACPDHRPLLASDPVVQAEAEKGVPEIAQQIAQDLLDVVRTRGTGSR